jgi:VWFA-related protein
MTTYLLQLTVLVTVITSLAAQQPGSGVLKVTSRLVQVNVIVQDKHGNPVSDLTREDFILTDNGRPQSLSVFSVEAPGRAAVDAASTGAALIVNNRTLSASANPKTVTVLFFDALNIKSVADAQFGKRELVKFLRTVQPGDPVALYSLNGPNVQVLHDFTDDTRSLIQSVQGGSGTHGSTYGSAMDAWLNEAGNSGHAVLRSTATEWTLGALEDVAHHLAGVPGRKNLVWVSSAFPIRIGQNPRSISRCVMSPPESPRTAEANSGVQDFSERENRVGRLFTEAQVAVYPVDPAGLQTDKALDASRVNIRPQSALKHMAVSSGSGPRIDSMLLLAKDTGGLAFYDSNDVAANIRSAADDAREAYTLGFYPPETAWDGKYHDLKVKVKRADLVVRARQGYLASTPAIESGPDRAQALQLAVASPLEGAAIGLQVQVQSNPLTWYGQKVVVEIDPHDLRFEARDGRMRSEVDLMFAQQTSDGRTIQSERKTFHYALPLDSDRDSLAQSVNLEKQLTIQPQATRVRIVVRDASTGAVGSVSIPVKSAAGI